MGRAKAEKYRKDLHQQAYDKLTSMQRFGESKREAKKHGSLKGKIFSIKTYETYKKHIKYFLAYVKINHPACTTLKKAKSYVHEWLDMRAATLGRNGKPLSAWTIQVEAKALGKLYGIEPDDDDYYMPPVRERKDIKRSRGTAARDQHFSMTNNAELVNFCRGSGLRREGLLYIRGNCLYDRKQIEIMIADMETRDDLSEKESKQLELLTDTRLFLNEEYYIYTREKGGKFRYAPLIGTHVQDIIDRIKATPDDQHVWQHVHSDADIHGFRGEYATAIYKEYARDIADIPYDGINGGTGRRYQKDVYICRKDERKRRLDRNAMFIVSKALGHNRVCIMADSYLRGI